MNCVKSIDRSSGRVEQWTFDCFIILTFWLHQRQADCVENVLRIELNEGVMYKDIKDILIGGSDLSSQISTFVKNQKTSANENEKNYIEFEDYKIMPVDVEYEHRSSRKKKENKAANSGSSPKNNGSAPQAANKCDQHSEDGKKSCEQEVRRPSIQCSVATYSAHSYCLARQSGALVSSTGVRRFHLALCERFAGAVKSEMQSRRKRNCNKMFGGSHSPTRSHAHTHTHAPAVRGACFGFEFRTHRHEMHKQPPIPRLVLSDSLPFQTFFFDLRAFSIRVCVYVIAAVGDLF